jgi:hypothetical protein
VDYSIRLNGSAEERIVWVIMWVSPAELVYTCTLKLMSQTSRINYVLLSLLTTWNAQYCLTWVTVFVVNTRVYEHLKIYVAGITQAVWPLATAWTVHRSNLGRSKVFCIRPDRPWGPHSLLYNGYRVFFLGLKRSGRGVNYPPPNSAEVKERVDLYLSFTFCRPGRL